MAVRHTTVMIAVMSLLLGLGLVATGPSAATEATLGAVLGPLPATASQGGPGTPSLNGLVSQACNAGTPIGFPSWFTLPTGDIGWLLARGEVDDDVTLGHGSNYTFPAHVALVDYASSIVLSCAGGPYKVMANHPAAVVVWISPDDAATYAEGAGGGVPPTSVFVTRTTATAFHDTLATALPIGELPMQSLEDTTMAGFDPPAHLPDTMGCWSEISGVYRHAVWWTWTAGWTGPLPAVVDSPDFRAVVLLAEAGPSGAVAVDLPRDVGGCPTGPYSVVLGKTYYVGVAYYSPSYYQVPSIEDSGFAYFYLGSPAMPSRPTVAVEPVGADSLRVSWSPPTISVGQPPITAYYVTLDNIGPSSPAGGGGRITLPATARSYLYTGLSADQRRHVTVQAVNSAGMGAPTTVSIVTGPAAAPAPGGVDATVDAAARTASIRWSAPAAGTMITGYRISRDGTDSGGTGAFSTTVGASARTFQFTSLLATSTYRLSVRAMTTAGDGRTATVATTVLASPVRASTPTRTWLTTDDAAGTATLTWAPPRDAGQSVITGYVVSRDGTDLGSSGSFSATVAATTRSYRFTSLNPWYDYRFSVAAVTAVGGGEPMTRHGTRRAATPPPPPGVTAFAGDRVATVSWAAPPGVPEAAPPDAYRVRLMSGTTRTVLRTATVGAGIFAWTMDALSNGTTYTFDVTSINAAGLGGVSLRSPVVTPRPPAPAASAPGPPKIGRASGRVVSGKVRAVVRWAPPLSDGGVAVTAYRVYAYRVSVAGAVLSVTASPRLAASLRACTMVLPVVGRYRFAVRAVNAVGYSSFSARSNLVVPARVPTAPRIVIGASGAAGGALTASARWAAPASDGGTVITAYRVYAFRVSSSGVVLGYTMSPLLRAKTRSYSMVLPKYGWYRFAVRAVNAMGYSPFSAKAARVIGR